MTNPYQAPLTSNGGVASFFIDCACGNRIEVVAAAAGTAVWCHCGREVDVPRLSELRRMAGQEAFLTNAVERTRAKLADGYLPGDGRCAVCGAEAKVMRRFDIVCEKTISVANNLNQGFVTMAFWLFFGWAGLLRACIRGTRSHSTELRGRDVWIRVPLAMCEKCAVPLEGERRAIRNLLELEYSDLFQEYPEATIVNAPA
jgi:hypothetical protein